MSEALARGIAAALDRPCNPTVLDFGDFLGPGIAGAAFCESRCHRWSLWRRWRPEATPREMLAFIGLNPSTATESEDDPTIRRCIGFAKRNGFGGLVMLNLFAYRTKSPELMKAARDPIGCDNNVAIASVVFATSVVCCCWGNDGAFRDRGKGVSEQLIRIPGLRCFDLGRTQQGEPKHPLYLKSSTPLHQWSPT